jgi:hypothetical protein
MEKVQLLRSHYQSKNNTKSGPDQPRVRHYQSW